MTRTTAVGATVHRRSAQARPDLSPRARGSVRAASPNSAMPPTTIDSGVLDGPAVVGSTQTMDSFMASPSQLTRSSSDVTPTVTTGTSESWATTRVPSSSTDAFERSGVDALLRCSVHPSDSGAATSPERGGAAKRVDPLSNNGVRPTVNDCPARTCRGGGRSIDQANSPMAIDASPASAATTATPVARTWDLRLLVLRVRRRFVPMVGTVTGPASPGLHSPCTRGSNRSVVGLRLDVITGGPS